MAGPGEYWLNGRKADTGSSYLWSSNNSDVSQELWGPGYPAITGAIFYYDNIQIYKCPDSIIYNIMYFIRRLHLPKPSRWVPA